MRLTTTLVILTLLLFLNFCLPLMGAVWRGLSFGLAVMLAMYIYLREEMG